MGALPGITAVYDYLVVGAGSAGRVLAARLSAYGASVALLEAAPALRRPAVPLPFPLLLSRAPREQYHTVPQPGLAGRALAWPTGHCCRGLDAVCGPGRREDFDAWARAGHPDWSYEHLVPYLRRAEGHSGAGRSRATLVQEPCGPGSAALAFLAACAETGLIDPAGVDLAQCGPVPAARALRLIAADLAPQATRGHRGVRVLSAVRVHRVILDEWARATGIEGVDRHGAPLSLSARREVVLSAGAVGSAHLLLRSGIGDPAHLDETGVTLRAKLPGVGHNLQDHLIVPLIANRQRPASPPPSGGARFRPRGVRAASLCEASVFVRTRPGLPAPDVQLGFLPTAYSTRGASRREEGVTIAVMLLQPRSRGRILLRGPDRAASPMINPGFLSDEAAVDLRTLVRGVRIAWRLLHTTRALAPFAGAPRSALDIADHAALARFVRRNAHSAHHPAGTCRMGTDEMAVVDGELRVHGVERLRVADASVMPTITGGHPRALSVAIAERAADLITGACPAGVPHQRS